MCPEQDSNLHTFRHALLRRTRLPVPPLRDIGQPGLEPSPDGSKPPVLPLHHKPIMTTPRLELGTNRLEICRSNPLSYAVNRLVPGEGIEPSDVGDFESPAYASSATRG